jgi:radical SAM superfamily enzyme YgiQ (UPF0313 family)
LSLNIALVNPPFIPHFGRSARWQESGRGGSMYYPLWLSHATGVLEKEYNTMLIDSPAMRLDAKETLSTVSSFSPDLIVIGTSFPSLKNDLKIARSMKENICAKIVFVGPPASVLTKRILENPGVDIVAKYEYDFTLKEIADTLTKNDLLKSVKGIAYKHNGDVKETQNRPLSTSEDLDKIPFVSSVYKKHLKIRDYFLSSSLHPEVQIFAGRGCPSLCTFCLWPQTFTGRVQRCRSVPNLIEELEYIQQELPEVKEVVFEDDTFTASRKYVQAVCKEIINRKLDVVWNCQTKATLDLETMKLMKRAGCRLMIVGFESGDDQILKAIKKGVSVNTLKNFADNAKKAGILFHADFILGLPGENKKTIEKTRSLIMKIRPDLLQVSVATPYPGTEFYDWAIQNGFLEITDDSYEKYLDTEGHQQSIISYPNLSSEEITKAVTKILKEYYLSPRYIPSVLKQIFRKNGIDEAKRIWASGKAFLSRFV